MKLKTVSALAPFMLLACGSPQKPVTFASSTSTQEAVERVTRTLAAEGYTPMTTDAKSGIVQTEWKDTGFMYGQVQGTTATIVRRFTVVVAPAGEGSNVTVRADAKRCAQGGFTIESDSGNSEVRGPCEELAVIPGPMQEQVDSLGAKVQQSVGAR